uniref:Trafficking protein particle complex subunit n=1 Tax=Corethron hystrix TaxID=216773 RepID=A0A7S1BQ75_9STRA|mmetsp:Transcript_37133/g.86602  ORF Transcript_37133/g.86602 Transcript_37133/m.86602 type:complete len:169 (+) Transcript_37133:212-718(+)
MSSPSLRFVIVGTHNPLYSAEFQRGGAAGSSSSASSQPSSGGIQGSGDGGSSGRGGGGGENSQSWFMLHVALDMVDKIAWINEAKGMYLRTVDKMMSQQVSAFQTAGSIKFLLIHSGQRSEDSIKNFFYDVYELYVKHSMNPFYKYNTAIMSKTFDARVRTLARKYLS